MANESPWYLNQSPLGAAYQHFSSAAKGKSVLDAKTKELLRLAIASVFRCRHCTEEHIKKALEAGATKQEITEAILISALQAAGTQMNWDREVFEKYLAVQGTPGD
jgi:AhpD family alkylhydroperoxidase